jgi:hypothetical protein
VAAFERTFQHANGRSSLRQDNGAIPSYPRPGVFSHLCSWSSGVQSCSRLTGGRGCTCARCRLTSSIQPATMTGPRPPCSACVAVPRASMLPPCWSRRHAGHECQPGPASEPIAHSPLQGALPILMLSQMCAPLAAQSQEWRSAQEWGRSRRYTAPTAATSRYVARQQPCSSGKHVGHCPQMDHAFGMSC